MGIHAFADRGFLIELSEFYSLFERCHMQGIHGDAVRLISDQASDSVAAVIEPLVNELRAAISVEDVATSLDSFVCSVRRAVGDPALVSHEPLQFVFKAICHLVLPIQPEWVGVITSQEVSMGDEIPLDTPLLWFNFDQCFAIKMTASGRQLARTLKRSRIHPYEWTGIL